MADHLKLVELHPDPSLRDIPNQLRALAQSIEDGEHTPETCIVLLSNKDENGLTEYPLCYQWGSVDGDNHVIVMLAMAQNFMLTRKTSR